MNSSIIVNFPEGDKKHACRGNCSMCTWKESKFLPSALPSEDSLIHFTKGEDLVTISGGADRDWEIYYN